ncbi:acyl-CoA thioesterase domain-containing protein, partial [Jatrophihabitans sp.]|uniref:thioesterase family protein n=1 Tax=Jatrophihabitans sp. TaxID=1932789 RepID=UPI0030C669B4|nr:hypothetical protein [Jatrophihabitans sp.]
MTDSYFHVHHEDEYTGTYLAEPATAGPWDPGLQHGGPPTALSVRAAERAAVAATGRTDLVAMRTSAEFVGPVPVGEVTLTARVVRVARSGALVETTVAAAGRPCLQARSWLIRDADTTAVSHPTTPQEPAAGLPGLVGSFPLGDTIEWRALVGGIHVPGPGVVWARPTRNLVGDEPLVGLARAALVGDSASGISSALDWKRWSFVNVDLDVHLARPVQGSWIL